jgi:hypothetical protein
VVKSNILVIGKQGPEKTIFISDIINKLYNIHNYENILICVEEQESVEIYKKKIIFPILHILKYVIINDKNIESLKINDKQKNLIIFDHCFSQKLPYEFYNKFAYINTTIISMIRFVYEYTPQFKSYFDYVMLFKENYIPNTQLMYSSYANFFKNYILFKNIFDKLTIDYGIMIIDNNEIVDKVYKYNVNI